MQKRTVGLARRISCAIQISVVPQLDYFESSLPSVKSKCPFWDVSHSGSRTRSGVRFSPVGKQPKGIFGKKPLLPSPYAGQATKNSILDMGTVRSRRTPMPHLFGRGRDSFEVARSRVKILVTRYIKQVNISNRASHVVLTTEFSPD